MGRMYLALAKERLSSLWESVWHRNLMRSGMVTGLVLTALVAGLALAYRERGTGHLTKLKAHIDPNQQFEETPVPRPGGQEAIVLTRPRMAGSSMPEFLSVTLLPGRGMNVLQIRAYVPARGEVDLLASPSVADATGAMTGKDEDAGGGASLAMGAAFELPWAGRIVGGNVSTGSASHVATTWRGHTFSLPATRTAAAPASLHGLFLAQASNSQEVTAIPDGGGARAVFNEGDFGGHWPSKTAVTVEVLLGSRTIELTVVARNAGDVAEPIGIGWCPRFAVSDDNRGQMTLLLPSTTRLEANERAPTGRLLPVTGTPYDFTARSGTRLGSVNLDETYVQLRQELLDLGPVAELSDPNNNYRLRLTALSPTIKAMHVVAPAHRGFISIDPQFNYDDPFGREWPGGTDTGMVVLQPGQSTTWKVRLELYSLSRTGPPI